MMGQKSYQISGEESIEAVESDEPTPITDEDVQTVMDQTQCSQDEATQALQDTNGNIAEAIILLTAEKEE
jgi:nascent polypeptide-associated complex subunit alpha